VPLGRLQHHRIPRQHDAEYRQKPLAQQGLVGADTVQSDRHLGAADRCAVDGYRNVLEDAPADAAIGRVRAGGLAEAQNGLVSAPGLGDPDGRESLEGNRV
jgi:hypothetical protein